MLLTKKLIVNGNVYEIAEPLTVACLETARDKYKEEKQYAIYAVEKDGIIEMKREISDSNEVLRAAVVKYQNRGFKVYYINKWPKRRGV